MKKQKIKLIFQKYIKTNFAQNIILFINRHKS